MKMYICIICGWVYDEEEGWPEEGITTWYPSGKMSLMTGCAQIVVQEKTILKWSNFDE